MNQFDYSIIFKRIAPTEISDNLETSALAVVKRILIDFFHYIRTFKRIDIAPQKFLTIQKLLHCPL